MQTRYEHSSQRPASREDVTSATTVGGRRAVVFGDFSIFDEVLPSSVDVWNPLTSGRITVVQNHEGFRMRVEFHIAKILQRIFVRMAAVDVDDIKGLSGVVWDRLQRVAARQREAIWVGFFDDVLCGLDVWMMAEIETVKHCSWT